MTISKKSIGIDVSKHTLDVFCLATKKLRQYKNTPLGIISLLTNLEETQIYRIVIEPTGGYKKPLLKACFAKASGFLEKNDTLDARVLAQYGALLSPPLSHAKDAQRQVLSDFVQRRRQVVDMLTVEKNRLEKYSTTATKTFIIKHIRVLEAEIKLLDKRIEAFLQSEALHEKARLLMSVKGVGNGLTSTLLGMLPELGYLDGQKIAKLVGVAPIARESGNWRGYRAICGGRSFVRKLLYMSTIVALTHNSTIKNFYQSLIQRGKKPKVSIVAAMRKLLIILNAKMRNHLLGEKVF